MHIGRLLFIKQHRCKKLPQITKSLACCRPVLLKIPLSQLELTVKTSRMLFRYLSAVTESSRSFRTILSQVDTDNSVCCDSCLREIIEVRLPRLTVSIFSSVRTLGRALLLNTVTFSKCVKCVTIGKIKFNHEYQLFRSENHSHR
jgi:hypothetical protein